MGQAEWAGHDVTTWLRRNGMYMFRFATVREKSAKNGFFVRVQRKAREFCVKSAKFFITFKSVKSQGISFLSCHKVCKRVSLFAKLNSYEGIEFCVFFASFIAKGFVLDGQ